MCGRYTLKTPVERLSEEFQFPQIIPLKPRYNIAPSQPVAVVRLLPDDTQRKLDLLHWGLIPVWTKDLKKARQPINAKAETVAELPSFRVAFRQRRCLIPADGFYEWQQQGRYKQPVYICMKDREPFAFAGLWEHWEKPDLEPIDSCVLLTTEPNELLVQVHNRMPVILDPRYYDLWLDPKVLEDLRLHLLLGPFPPDQMTAHPVSLRVNNPKNDDALCIEPQPP